RRRQRCGDRRSNGANRPRRRTALSVYGSLFAHLSMHAGRAGAPQVYRRRPGRDGTHGMSQSVWLVRHGQTAWNLSGQYLGAIDVDLDDLGLKQAQQLASWAAEARIDAIVSSPARRAWHTASMIGTHLAIDPRVDDRLRELDF